MKEKIVLNERKSRAVLILVLTIIMQLIIPIFTGTSNVYAATTYDSGTITLGSLANGDVIKNTCTINRDNNSFTLIVVDDDGITQLNSYGRDASRNIQLDYTTKVIKVNPGMGFREVTVQKVTHSVALNTNDGTIVEEDITKYTEGIGATLPTDVTKDGYTFGGWFADEELTGNAVTSIGADDTEDKEYWAKWTPNTYTVTLNTNDGTIDSGDVTNYTYGTETTLPTDVTKEGYTFVGWCDNEILTGDIVTEISAEDIGDKEYWAKWEEVIALKYKKYTIEAQNPNVKDTISFTALEGNVYDFSINNILSITDEQLQAVVDMFNDPEITLESLKQEFNKLVGYGENAVAGKGDLLKLYEIYLYNNGVEIHEIEGGFELKLKITDDMKGYDSYKLIYISEDGTTEDAITLAVNGDYLEGTLPHLSMYALAGSKTETTTTDSNKTAEDTTETTNTTSNNPKTGDNIIVWIIIMIISILGIVVTAKLHKKNKKI